MTSWAPPACPTRADVGEIAPTLPLDDETSGARGTSEPGPLTLPERYRDIRGLGVGGFGEVRLVFDGRLERPVAMKILRHDLVSTPEARARFLAEIKLTAGLLHPGIVPVHDYGDLPDGRLWFTMAVVRGRTLHAVIDEAFAPGAPGQRPTRRRLVDLFARACEAVAHAHSRGLIHRDLKPENVMVGDFGRVLVMDWGIARRLDGDAVAERAAVAGTAPGARGTAADAEGLTRLGEIIGTPAYMPPEQARGDVRLHGPAMDVYALGAILYHLLSGRPPYSGASGMGVLSAVLAGPPSPLVDVPPALAAVCGRAMARDPADRYADAGELAAAIGAFLDGAQRREQALLELARAEARTPVIAAARERVEALRGEAKRLLAPVRPADPVAAKLPGWELEDEAERLTREVALEETLWEQQVHGALAIDPDLDEAHAALADHYRAALVEAERARRPADAARFEVLLRAHDRGRHAAFLSGAGALTVLTEPAGARVVLRRAAVRERRLVLEPPTDLGLTPFCQHPLPRGSYFPPLSAPVPHEVTYPVQIERAEHWDGRPPGGDGPEPIRLPALGDIGADEVYVPAGWAWTGGDPDAPDGLPRRRVWIDGFVMGRTPVTNEEYVAFLDDLLAAGREDEALAFCPRSSRGIVAHADHALAYERGPDGRFRLPEHDPPEVWTPRSPVVLVSWHAAVAYAAWRAARARRPYRLPDELEREKAARGVDGRLFPWGDAFDPTWARMSTSHARGQPSRVDVDATPFDVSPYGMLGGAGNSNDWCGNVWRREGPRVVDGRLHREVPAAGDGAHRAVRGGAWTNVANYCRAAARFGVQPDQWRSTTGLRLCRSWPG